MCSSSAGLPGCNQITPYYRIVIPQGPGQRCRGSGLWASGFAGQIEKLEICDITFSTGSEFGGLDMELAANPGGGIPDELGNPGGVGGCEAGQFGVIDIE